MKRILVAFLVLALVFTFSSCRRKDDGKSGGTDAAVKTFSASAVQKESPEKTGGTVSGSVSIPSSPSFSRTEEVLPDVTPSAPLSLVDGAGEEDGFVLNEVYRGGDIMIRARITGSEARLSFNIGDDEISAIKERMEKQYAEGHGNVSCRIEDKTLILSYPETDENVLEEQWKNFRDFLNSCNEEKALSSSRDAGDELVICRESETVIGKVSCEICSDRAEIIMPEGLGKDELEAFTAYLSSSFPYLTELGSFSCGDNEIVFTYSGGFSNRDASELWQDFVFVLTSYFSPSPAAEETARKETASSTADGNASFSVTGDSPVTEGGKRIRRFSLSFLAENSFDTRDMYVFSALLRLDCRITENFSLGLASGWDASGYIPFLLSARLGLFGGPLYAGAMAGVNFPSQKDANRLFSISLALGLEHDISDVLSVFAEAAVGYMPDPDRMRAGITFGGRFRF